LKCYTTTIARRNGLIRGQWTRLKVSCTSAMRARIGLGHYHNGDLNAHQIESTKNKDNINLCCERAKEWLWWSQAEGRAMVNRAKQSRRGGLVATSARDDIRMERGVELRCPIDSSCRIIITSINK